jgi:intein/homing endonuclease
VCAGTKVWDKNGNLINIEDVTDSIIGFDGNTHSKEEVTYHQPKAYKECVRIELEGSRHLECSCDHPLMTNTSARFDKNKTLTFKRAEDLTVNNYLVVPTNLNLFGTKRM